VLTLTHYYHKDDSPFQSLSLLTDDAALCVISNLRNRSGTVYQRFRNPEQYLQQRRATENWVRQEFIKQGGRPALAYPYYFVVDRSTWIEAGFNGESCMVQFSASTFPPEQISFTYPDSMISYWLKSQANQAFYRPEYHGQVFNLKEICQIIEMFGLPNEAWQTDATRKYDLFIEAQVWTSIPLIFKDGSICHNQQAAGL
jgi:hypothetical protein